MKIMTEIQAWEYCAKAFKKVEKHPAGNHYCVNSNGRPCGICDVIAFSDFPKQICDSMYKEIDAKKFKTKKDTYIWPLDKEGAKERVKFCRLKIRELQMQSSK